MPDLISMQEEYKLKRKLVLENIRRVFLASLACVALIPVLMFINKSSVLEAADITHGALVFFEIFSGISVVLSFIALKNRDVNLAKLMYRTFWFIFEAFAFVLIYSDKVGGAGFTFYSVTVIALFLIPAMGLSEQIYYIVALAVYTIFMEVKFGVNYNEIFNLVITDTLLLTVSRLNYTRLVERLTLKEQERVHRDSEVLDSLTGLLNRKGFEQRVYSEMRGCIASRRRISLLMIDVDDMGRYNDSYGAEHGDECIRAVSELVKQIILRNTDTICRLNGGRFLVYMEGGNDMEPVALAEKVRQNVERKRITHGRRAANEFVTVSIGVASCVPKSENDFSELYDEAEDALFEAKEQGKNVTVYDEQVYGRYQRRAAY